MGRGLSRTNVAILISLLAILVAGSQALARPSGASNASAPGAAYKLPEPEDRTLRSRQPGYEILNADDRSLEIIIGSDDREQVTNTTNFPNSSITYIEAWDDDEDYVYLCTAAFVGPNVLLTAAHCLWIPEFGGYPDGIAVAPGLNGNNEPFGIDFASEIWVPEGWSNTNGNINHAYEFDYGLIVLDNNDLGNSVGQFTVSVLDSADLSAADFQPSTAGYPGDKPLGTQWFGSSDAFKSVQSNLLVHEIDAFQGQSGSPVWRGRDLSVVGVISFETPKDNYARRITQGVMDDLNAACSDMGCAINQGASGGPVEPPTGPEPTPTEGPVPEPSPTGEPAQPSGPAPGDLSAFDRTYSRTDNPVESGLVNRTWMWGPAFTDILAEPYDESNGGHRAVLYREKSRMEITYSDGDPFSIWYVTNGLIAKELVTGQMQVGNNRFEDRAPANINVAGDASDPNAPTYSTFLELLGAPPLPQGSTVTSTVDRAGTVGDDPSLASHGVTAAHFVPETNHTVASVFWNFMNSAGLVYDDGDYREDLLFQSPYFATGLPISEPYWARVFVGGTERTVLVQVFERRVLTYTPGNPPGWDVEAGNVGSHYYEWRYQGQAPA